MVRSIAEIFRSHGVTNSEGKHINGTDKETNHSYGEAYESLLQRMYWRFDDNDKYVQPRDVVRHMMEVGVADGSCLQAWKEIFPNAIIVGMDIHHSDKAHGERIEFHIGDQRSREDCERAASGRLFDLIVEDATHRLDATLLTLLYLWPSVRPGGVYVIEEFADIHALRRNVELLWPNAEVINTQGPFGGIEPLVVLRKSL